jgi:hypothetical protein
MDTIVINTDVAMQNAADLLTNFKIRDTICHNKPGYWLVRMTFNAFCCAAFSFHFYPVNLLEKLLFNSISCKQTARRCIRFEKANM